MNNYLIWGTLFLIIFGLIMGVFMMIFPKFFVNQTLYWNKWFLNLIGYEVDIKQKISAEKIIRVWGMLFIFITLIGLSMGFDIFMMLFRQ